MVSHLHAFGSEVYVHIPSETIPRGSKLQPRAIKGIFVDYTGSSKIFRIYIPTKNIAQVTRKVFFPPQKSGEKTIDVLSSFSENAMHPNSSSLDENTLPTSNPIQTRPISPVSSQLPGTFVETPRMSRRISPVTPSLQDSIRISPGAPKKPHENLILQGLPPLLPISLKAMQPLGQDSSHDQLPRRSTREKRQTNHDPTPGITNFAITIPSVYGRADAKWEPRIKV